MNVVRGWVTAASGMAVALLIATLPAQGARGATTGLSPTPAASSTDPPSADPTTTPTPAETPTPTPSATTPADDRLLPDLVALPAGKPRIQVSNGRLLRFESSLGNIGAGPVEVRPDRTHTCPSGQQNSTQVIYRDANRNGRYNRTVDKAARRHRAGCMVYHPAHSHWHFQASAHYTLVDPSQESRVVVSARRKVSFCLRDSARLPARYGSFTHRNAYGSCTRTKPQGISIGWMDVYQSWLAGQSLRLPKNLKNGVYCLETTVDPLNALLESNDKNNKSIRAVLIRGNRVAVHEASRCRR